MMRDDIFTQHGCRISVGGFGRVDMIASARAAFRPTTQISDYAHIVDQYLPREVLHPKYEPRYAWPTHELAHYVLVGRDRRRSRMMGLESESALEKAAQECAANTVSLAMLGASLGHVYSAFLAWRGADRVTRAEWSPWSIVLEHEAALSHELQATVHEVHALRADPWVVARSRELLEATPYRPWWGLADWRAECAL